MATIDIRGLFNIIESHVSNGTLTLPKDAIDSEPIRSIYTEFMNDGPLVLGNAVPVLNIAANIITIAETTGQSFPLQGTTVDAVFTIINGIPQMELAGHLAAGAGSLTKPFPKLVPTLYKTLAFQEGSLLSLASYDAALTRPRGLALDAVLLLDGDLMSIRVLFNDEKLPVYGPMTVTADIPVFTIESEKAGTIRIGNFGDLSMHFELADEAVQSGQDFVASATMQVVSSVDYKNAGQEQSLDIYTPTPFTLQEILFQGDITEALELGMAAVSTLADSANVQGFLPTQLPIPPWVRFKQWTLTLNSTTAAIRTVTVEIELDTQWAIVPDLLELALVNFTFTYSTVSDTAFSMIVAAVVNVGSDDPLDGSPPALVDLVAIYPGFLFSGQLRQGSEIDVNAIIKRFVGDDAAAIITIPLKISELQFSVDPANVNFSFLIGISTDWDLTVAGVTIKLTKVRCGIDYVASRISAMFSASFQVVVDDPFTLTLTAGYDGVKAGWFFKSTLTQGRIKLASVIKKYAPVFESFPLDNLDVTALEARFQSGTNQSYGFTIAVEWSIAADIFTGTAAMSLDAFPDPAGTGVTKYLGYVEGAIQFYGVPMSARVDMTQTTPVYTFSFWGVTAVLQTINQQSVVTFTLPDRSLGELLEVVLNALLPGEGITLPPPFNVLNAIRLNRFGFEFNFTTRIAKVKYPNTGDLGLNFGFLAIDQFELVYDVNQKVVDIRIAKGRFLDTPVTPTNPQVFHASDPSSMASQVPGQGDKLLDLRFLGMGQRVSPETPIPPGATIATAVTMLENAFIKVPVPPPVNPLQPVSPIKGTKLKFDDAANWIIAADFVILSTVTIKALFLDPEMYGVSIGVNGPKGGNFNGLSFDILYRRVNDNVGVYQIELKLPDAFRQLEFGTVTITLPIIKVEIFTNGDFRIDLGFPANGDFTRSFGVQVLPFTGAGGLYFGVMSGASSTKVPATQCGTFSPVLELGVGLRVGIGKEINKGILSAGLSITLQGIVEGVIAWYSPYNETDAAAAKTFFYSIRGKFSIVGNLYGEINFAIISARLDITVQIGVTLFLQIYEPLEFGFFASVRVSLTVKINLGIFRISIDLSFRTEISYSFTIGSKQPAPWENCQIPYAQRKGLRGSTRRLGTTPLDDSQCPPDVPDLKWQPILRGTADRFPVELVAVTQLTAASPIAGGVPGPAKAQGVTALFSRTTTEGTETEAPFIIFAKGIFLWGMNAYLFREQTGSTLQELLASPVTAEDLQNAYCGMLKIPLGGVEPFSEEELDAFVAELFRFNLKAAAVSAVQQNVSAVPIVPAITMTLPGGEERAFDSYNETSTLVLDDIKEYFRELQTRAAKAADGVGTMNVELTLSMATFLWLDFFAMIARESMQGAIDALAAATIESTGTESLRQLVESRPLGRSVREVAKANLTRPLQTGARLSVASATHQVDRRNATLLGIARAHGVDALALALENQDVDGLFAPGRLLVPNATETTVEALLGMIDFNNLSGLAARVLLAGLRPPYPDGQGNDVLRALYDISGQQFDASAIQEGDTVTLNIPTADWIGVDGGGTSLPLPFSKTEADIAAGFNGITLLPTYTVPLQQQPLYRIQPRRFTLANPTAVSQLVAGAPLRSTNENATGQRGIWTFPDDLQSLITGESALRPKVTLIEEAQDAPNLKPYELNELLGEIPHVWATTVPIVVRQIPSAVDTNAPIPKTYDLRGTTEAGGVLLQQILSWSAANGGASPIAGIQILYPPDPAQPNPPEGLVAADPATVGFFLLQTNLSTVSNPPSTAALSRRALEEETGLINQTPLDFVRLVWECSIVRSGGYDLYYAAGAEGLPSYLFEQNNDVELTLLITSNIANDVLESFLNSVVIEQPVEEETTNLYFIRAEAQTVPAALAGRAEPLAKLAERHHITVAELAALNKTRRLRAGGQVRVPQKGLTVTATWEDTLESLAAKHGTSVAALAVANRDVRNLFDTNPVVEDQLIERVIQIPPGNNAWQGTRTAPDAPEIMLGDAVEDEAAQDGLQELYNLVTFQIFDNGSFETTKWSLPVGPAHDGEGEPDATQWPYRAVFPVAQFAKSGSAVTDTGSGPDPADSPYRGVGSDVRVDLEYLDMFGNRVTTNSGPPTTLPLPVLYFDDLMPVEEWAGSGVDYTITGDGIAPATLTVTLTFDTSPYLTPGEGVNPVELALAVEQKYARAWYQIAQGNGEIIVALNSTSDTTVDTSTPGAREQLLSYLGAVYDFIHAVATGGTPVTPPSVSLTRTVAANNPEDLFELIVSLTIERTKYIDPNLDDPAFAAVRKVTSNVQPNYTAPPAELPDDPQEPLTLEQFARQLETAFPTMKVAVGTPETGSDGKPKPRQTWLLRLSNTDGVWYTIDKDAPRFYAIAPISRAPESNDAEIYPYVSGQFIGDGTPVPQSFSNIDLEVLAQEFLAAVEQFLQPDYVVPAWKVLAAAGQARPNAIDAILEAKMQLAGDIAETVAPIWESQENPPADALAAAVESVRQQLLINLTSTFSIDTVVQYPVTVTSDFTDPEHAPRLYGKPLMLDLDIEEEKNYSLTTTRFSLQPGSRYLTFSFSTRSDRQASVVELPLRLGVSNIERPLDGVEGIPDYRPSSWLTFAIPFADDGRPHENDDLGTPGIPVPLRAYPTPPSMVAQSGQPLLAKQEVTETTTLEEARAWIYDFTYEYPPADQDTVYATVTFQSLSSLNMMEEEEPTLFDALVQFRSVYRQILADFNATLLVPGDPEVALNAVKSFAWIVERTAAAWKSRSEPVLLTDETTATTTQVTVKESTVTYQGMPGVLLVTVAQTAGAMLPAVSIPGYKAEPQSAEPGTASYVFLSLDTGLPLLRDDAQRLARRSLRYDGLDVLVEESALAGTHVRRNESLGQKTSDVFIYQTPEILFFTPLTPVLEPDVTLDLTEYTTPPATLETYLKNFLHELFDGAPAGSTHTVRMSGRFAYPLQPVVPLDPTKNFPVALPIFLTGPIPVSSTADLDALAAKTAAFTVAWFAKNGITGKAGLLWFDVSLYAGEANTQLPTLRLNRIRVDTSQVVF